MPPDPSQIKIPFLLLSSFLPLPWNLEMNHFNFHAQHTELVMACTFIILTPQVCRRQAEQLMLCTSLPYYWGVFQPYRGWRDLAKGPSWKSKVKPTNKQKSLVQQKQILPFRSHAMYYLPQVADHIHYENLLLSGTSIIDMTEATCGSEGPQLYWKYMRKTKEVISAGFVFPGLPSFCATYQDWLWGLIFVQVAAEASNLMLSDKNSYVLTITEKSCRQRRCRFSTA